MAEAPTLIELSRKNKKIRDLEDSLAEVRALVYLQRRVRDLEKENSALMEEAKWLRHLTIPNP